MTRIAPTFLRAALLAAALAATGCGHAYVNPNIADPAEAKSRLKADTALCKQEANSDVPPTYGMERFEYDPTIEAQATRWVANVAEDDANLDAFSRCMRRRGWRYKK
jgi:hypothetical protein